MTLFHCVRRPLQIVLPLAAMLLPFQLCIQAQQTHPKIAVVRLKSSEETPERKYIVKDLSADLTAALKADGRLDVPDESAMNNALDKEGLRREALIDVGKCFDVGSRLNCDFMVVGSALVKGIKIHACVRLYAVKNKSLVTTEDVEYGTDQMNLVHSVLASRIRTAIENPAKGDSVGKGFEWKGEYLLSFGKHRIDMEPPILLAVCPNPPFELSVVAEMSAAGGNFAVTNFEVYVDNVGLGSIHGQLSPPVPIKERDLVIGGVPYLFSLDLMDMRVFKMTVDNEDANFVTSAKFSVSVHPKQK
ncbi:MAG TPA: hypothetical protein VMH23_17470 [Bacteroidota bacterium]|nr:hypothetical protein [Bacteroidota bacterium]